MYKRQVQLGTTGDSDATEYEKNDGSTVERYNKGADAIQALKTGKIDCVIIDPVSYTHLDVYKRQIKKGMKEKNAGWMV